VTAEPELPPEQPDAAAEPAPAAPPPGRRRHPVLRALGVLVGIVVALIVASL